MVRVGLALAGAVALVVLWLRRRYVLVAVDGVSMQPTYTGGERVLVLRTPPAVVELGQVVVLEVPRWEQDPLWPLPPHTHRVSGRSWMIKRVAALAGQATPEEFADAAGLRPGDPVPLGHLLVAGDNTRASYDSRHFGLVPVERVLGIAMRVTAGVG